MKSKRIRQWVKQEKRLVKLAYRAGLVDDVVKNIDWLYWDELTPIGRNYSSGYYPEVYFETKDYWGEINERSLMSHIHEILYWSGVNPEECSMENITSSFKPRTRSEFIEYIKSLPKKRNDSKINKVLINQSF